jgi:hypothetical protein
MRGSGLGCPKVSMPFFGRHRRAVAATALVGSAMFLLAIVSSASALTLGMNWRGSYAASDINLARQSGASVYHLPINYSDTHGGNWASVDNVVTAAWEDGITILPTLIRTAGGENRFLLPKDPDWGSWGSWAREAVERYGVNGSFWSGKEHPTPITAWEVWNEPNLIENNPIISRSECKAIGQPFYEAQNTCIQPGSYAVLLQYTAEEIQAGSVTKTGHGTNALFGGLYQPGGENYGSFLSNASSVGISGAVTGVAIHPYPFNFGVSRLEEEVNGARNALNSLGWGEKTLWITEFGYPVGGSSGFPTNGQPVSEPAQASLLTQSLNWITEASGSDKIELAAWFSIGDYSSGSHWAGSCGLIRSDGSKRPAWDSFRQFALQPESSPPLIGVLTSGTAFVKEGDLHNSWVEEFGGINSLAVANSYVNGAEIGVLTNSGVGWAKSGGLYAEWVEEFGGIKQIVVASDPAHGPMVGVLTNSGVAFVKQGSLRGGWVEESPGVRQLSVATDRVNGPIIGVVTESGESFVKEGSLTAPWIEEFGGVKSISVASDPVDGPVIGALTNTGVAWVKKGSLTTNWVEELGGVQQLAVAADRVNGPLIGTLTNAGVEMVKQGDLNGPWVEEFGGIKSIAVASDPYNGALIGAINNAGVAFVKDGDLHGEWVEETPGAQEISLAG